jgi:hypothetical protein
MAMEPPSELAAEAARFWRDRRILCRPVRPGCAAVAGRTDPRDGRCGQIATELDRLRGHSLTSSTKGGAATRQIFMQLAAARD